MWPLDCFYLIALFSRFTYSYLPALSIRQSHPCLLWTAVPVSTSPLKIFLLRDIFYWSLNLIVVLRSSNYKGRQRVKSRVQTCACVRPNGHDRMPLTQRSYFTINRFTAWKHSNRYSLFPPSFFYNSPTKAK